MATGAVHEVAGGVFTLRYELFDQNIGVVVGDGRVLVIDTRSSHRQARELQDDVRRITAHPWVVVNSHHHFDHTFGNAPFMPAEIWGHERCAAAMHEGGERTKHRIAEEMPELAAELAEVTITPPTRTIADRARIDVGGRVVELRYLGRGHTDNDLAVLVPDSASSSGGTWSNRALRRTSATRSRSTGPTRTGRFWRSSPDRSFPGTATWSTPHSSKSRWQTWPRRPRLPGPLTPRGGRRRMRSRRFPSPSPSRGTSCDGLTPSSTRVDAARKGTGQPVQ